MTSTIYMNAKINYQILKYIFKNKNFIIIIKVCVCVCINLDAYGEKK